MVPMTREYIESLLNKYYETYKPLREGVLPSYIPQLSRVDPDPFSICLVTMEGEVYEVGDPHDPFTIQSMCKPFLHGLALDAHGQDFIRKKIGVEPTGDPFNAIKLQPKTNRPYNPMVNAGAIALSSLVPGKTPQEKIHHIQNTLELFAGKSLTIDQDVYRSEKETGHHNRAMAHLMLNFGIINGDVEETLDVYFQACSFLVTCRDLAHMAAILANEGSHLTSQQPIIQRRHAKELLSVMFTCGMYDFAGEWACTVGFPGKSGVSGGIIGVVPHKIGLCVFSPRLDSRGNSIRGIRVFQDIARDLELSIF